MNAQPCKPTATKPMKAIRKPRNITQLGGREPPRRPPRSREPDRMLLEMVAPCKLMRGRSLSIQKPCSFESLAVSPSDREEKTRCD